MATTSVHPNIGGILSLFQLQCEISETVDKRGCEGGARAGSPTGARELGLRLGVGPRR